jgi:hypothetical protein
MSLRCESSDEVCEAAAKRPPPPVFRKTRLCTMARAQMNSSTVNFSLSRSVGHSAFKRFHSATYDGRTPSKCSREGEA